MILARRLGALLKPARRSVFNFANEAEKPKPKASKPLKAASEQPKQGATKIGQISQVIGAVVDVQFEG